LLIHPRTTSSFCAAWTAVFFRFVALDSEPLSHSASTRTMLAAARGRAGAFAFDLGFGLVVGFVFLATFGLPDLVVVGFVGFGLTVRGGGGSLSSATTAPCARAWISNATQTFRALPLTRIYP
jgi:hypothetical protein